MHHNQQATTATAMTSAVCICLYDPRKWTLLTFKMCLPSPRIFDTCLILLVLQSVVIIWYVCQPSSDSQTSLSGKECSRTHREGNWERSTHCLAKIVETMLVVILTLRKTVTQLIKHILKNWALRTKDNMKQICNPWLPWCWINFFTKFLPTSSTKLFTIGFDFHDWGWCHFEFRQPGVPAMLDMLRSPGTPKASPLLSLEVEKPSLEVKEVLPLLQPGSFKLTAHWETVLSRFQTCMASRHPASVAFDVEVTGLT